MVNLLIRWCLKNPFLMVLITAGLCVGGYFAVVRTPVDAIPDIGEKQVIVTLTGRAAARRTWTTRSRSLSQPA
jgi:Cu/Ag efflux pump CusA